MFIAAPAYVQQLNDISFWYPILDRIGMRTPDTQLFYVSQEVGRIIDGDRVSEFEHLAAEVDRVREQFGGTAFLRTGQTSNKHDWLDTCYLDRTSKTRHHLASLIEFSMMVDLPYTTFAVRRMLETVAVTVAFRNMPITREVRMFAEAGNISCAHPYWPTEAFRACDDVTQDQLDQLQEMPDMTELNQMAEYVSRHFESAWSIDFLQDASGDWWLIDMALASSSYHWPGCEHGAKR